MDECPESVDLLTPPPQPESVATLLALPYDVLTVVDVFLEQHVLGRICTHWGWLRLRHVSMTAWPTRQQTSDLTSRPFFSYISHLWDITRLSCKPLEPSLNVSD
eukprot:NODE_8145_length_382_cov_5.545098_g7979_i0.p1 GENE.NODE_8145_length_382_cov_5.545098_g7979_i0~~NODE_8145_length_382_cov_5.545098_g7979_i0.p1  ORF type:complete len:104 (+),score=12.06 NODE_8145_length_382_cov_5.545098_g7979_i0:3-314(+)